MKICLSLFAAVCLCFTVASAVRVAAAAQDAAAQDTAAQDTAAQDTAAQDVSITEYETVYAQWRGILGKLAAMQTEYQTAKPDERTAIEQQYKELVTEGTEMMPKLKAAAEKALDKGTAEKKREIGDLLATMAMNSLKTDDYEESGRLAKELLRSDYKQPGLWTLAGVAAFNMNDFAAADNYFQAASKAGTLDGPAKQQAADIKKYEEMWGREKAIREAEAKADDLPRVKLTTSQGDIVLELFENEAPNTVANFISLVEKKYYDGTKFHRVLPGFMAQGGDPKGDGSGGPGYHIKGECDRPDHRDHFRGSLSMAHTGQPDSGGSQFFLTFVPTGNLDGKHTVFGRVIDGLDVLAKLQRVNPDAHNPIASPPDKIIKAVVLRKRNHEYEPEKVPAG